MHAGLLQVHVQAGNLGFDNPLGHALRCSAHVERIAIEQRALPCTLAMSFQHVDGLDGILDLLTICIFGEIDRCLLQVKICRTVICCELQPKDLQLVVKA